MAFGHVFSMIPAGATLYGFKIFFLVLIKIAQTALSSGAVAQKKNPDPHQARIFIFGFDSLRTRATCLSHRPTSH